MNYSENYNFNLPTRDGEDIADINIISENFVALDGLLNNLETVNRTQNANIVNVNSKAIQNETDIEENRTIINAIGAEVNNNKTDINANGVKIENNKTDINLLLLGNGVDLADTIPTSSVTVDGVKYNWSVDAKKITVNCSNTAATSYDFCTFDLTGEMLKNKTLSLIAKSNNANVVCRYTLTNHQGNTASGVLDGSAYSINTASYRSVMLTITTTAGYRGVSTIELSLKYKTTHSDLLSNINDVADDVAENSTKINAVETEVKAKAESLVRNNSINLFDAVEDFADTISATTFSYSNEKRTISVSIDGTTEAVSYTFYTLSELPEGIYKGDTLILDIANVSTSRQLRMVTNYNDGTAPTTTSYTSNGTYSVSLPSNMTSIVFSVEVSAGTYGSGSADIRLTLQNAPSNKELYNLIMSLMRGAE